MIMFHRKVLKADQSVECSLEYFGDGERFDVGMVKFPNKTIWTKFWGAVHRGAIYVPDFEVHMENVPDADTPQQDDPQSSQTNEGSAVGQAK